jgi:hypothetical protein
MFIERAELCSIAEKSPGKEEEEEKMNAKKHKYDK